MSAPKSTPTSTAIRSMTGYGQAERAAVGVFGAVGLLGTFGGVNARAEKQAFLEGTFEARLAMRADHGARVMRGALDELPAYLAAVWRYEPWSVRVRKRVLFELWDECAESGPANVVASARTARAVIVSFIRRKLPAGSRDAYPALELRQLNAKRTSAARFEPYRAAD
jgi:hypothetical protein